MNLKVVAINSYCFSWLILLSAFPGSAAAAFPADGGSVEVALNGGPEMVSRGEEFLGSWKVRFAEGGSYRGIYFNADAPGRLFDGAAFGHDVSSVANVNQVYVNGSVTNSRTFGIFGKQYLDALSSGKTPDVRGAMSASFALPEVDEDDIISISHTSYYRVDDYLQYGDWWAPGRFARNSYFEVSGEGGFLGVHSAIFTTGYGQNISITRDVFAKINEIDAPASGNVCQTILFQCYFSVTHDMEPDATYYRGTTARYYSTFNHVNGAGDPEYFPGHFDDGVALVNYLESYVVTYKNLQPGRPARKIRIDVSSGGSADFSSLGDDDSGVFMEYVDGSLRLKESRGYLPALEFTMQSMVPEPSSGWLLIAGILGLRRIRGLHIKKGCINYLARSS